MNMTCTNRVIKQTMFVFNFIFVITGIIILAVGASVKAKYYPYNTFLDDKYFSLPNMLIATGSLIFFISFLGCYGAMRENWVLLMIFSILLTIIFIFELSVGIAGYVLRDRTSNFLQGKLLENMQHYGKSPPITSMWDIIQEDFQCCGVTNYDDWKNTFNNNSLPISCCPQSSGIVGAFYCNSFVAPTTTPNVSNATLPASTTEEPTTGSSKTTEEPPTESSKTTQEQITIIVTDDLTTEITETTESPDPSPASNLYAEESSTYPPSSSQPFVTGCLSAFGSFVKSHAVDIGAVGIALAVIQLGGIILSFHLARQLKNGYYST